jgi:hypothetical protein
VYATAGEGIQIDGSNSLALNKQPLNVLTIQSVTPRYAIGTMEGVVKKPTIKIGDWVRSQ